VSQAREEYAASADVAADRTRQDAAVLNIQRAREAALDMGQHLIRRDRLGLPQRARDVFALLARAGRIDTALAATMQKMGASGTSPSMTVCDCCCPSRSA
jgi:uncharacterized protein YutE (UPF0331/DUF86 family)